MLWVLKMSQRDCSFEHPKQMLKLMDKKIFLILRSIILSKLAYATLYYISRLAGLEV